MRLSVVIPSFNGLTLLQQSIPLLIQSINTADIKDYEIVVVDNGSTDKSQVYVRQWPHTVCVFNQKPLGFARAVNVGIKKSQGRYLLLLNNDCLLNKHAIARLINYLKTNPSIWFTQPLIHEGGQKTVGYKVDLTVAKARTVTENTSAKLFLKQDDIFKKGYFYGLSATCLMLKQNTLEKVGLFDESFGSYLEDIDFCLRAIAKKVSYAPCIEASVTHLHMQTSKKMGPYKAKHDFVNWVRIIQRHYPRLFLLNHFSALFIERGRNLSGWIKAIF